MIKNFELDQSSAIIYSDDVYDLHNCYDYIGVTIVGKSCELKIKFELIIDYGKGKPTLSLVFKNIKYLEFNKNFGSIKITGIEELGYKNPNDTDDSWLLNKDQATKYDHLFIRLENNEFIRVYSE